MKPKPKPPPADPPTAQQRAVYDFIERYVIARGVPPTYREVMDALGFSSTNAVACHVRPLVRKGWLRAADETSQARGLVPTGLRVSVVRPDGTTAGAA